MNFIEAVKKAMNGHDIYRRYWKCGIRKITAETPTCGGLKVLILWNHENVGEFQGNTSDYLADDWESTKTFQEAVEEMKSGKKVRRIGWRDTFPHLRMIDGRFYIMNSDTGIGDERIHFNFHYDDIESTDWIVWE